MTPETYLAHVRAESARFRDVLAGCDPAARVPTCPDWTATDLLWHLGADVQAFWAHVVTTRPAPPADWDEDPAPTGDDAHAVALARFDEAHAGFVAAMEAADPAEAAWTWSTEQTVAFTFRRQAHEALVHRVDAELTAGLPVGPIDAALAADGVLETLDVMFGHIPPWGAFAPSGEVARFEVADAPDGAPVSVHVALGVFSGTDPRSGKTYADEQEVTVVADPGPDAREPDVVVSGSGAAIDLWLWHRGDDAAITVTGDAEVAADLRTRLDQPIN